MSPRNPPPGGFEQNFSQPEGRSPGGGKSTDNSLNRRLPADGSPGEGEPVFLVVGKLHRPHGVHGEIIMEVITDYPERLRRDLLVYIGPDFSPYTLRSVRQHAGGILVAFKGQMDRDAVAGLRNKNVYVRADELPSLPEGEYYHHQVIGLRVFNETGEALGTLTEILETGAHDVYLIRPESGQDILLPVLESTILDVDLERGEMHVHVLPGILPGEQESE